MSLPPTSDASALHDPEWPGPADQAVTFLVDASSRLEERLLLEWIERRRPELLDPAQVEVIRLPASRQRKR